jgi:hypothetical protein
MMFTAIEQIKKGKLYDFRYSYKTFWIDSPQIWVFCNWLPDTSYLSMDRWKVWNINDAKEFVEMTAAQQAIVFRQQRRATMEEATPVADAVVAPPVIQGPPPDDQSDDDQVTDTEVDHWNTVVLPVILMQQAVEYSAGRGDLSQDQLHDICNKVHASTHILDTPGVQLNRPKRKRAIVDDGQTNG